MKEKIGYYGVLACLLFSVISGQFLTSEWVPVILCIGIIIFAPLYRWKEWKTYSRKKKIIYSVEFVIIISTIPFLLLKGYEQMNDIAIFQGWLLFAKWLYLILIFIMLAVVFKGINGKIFANE
ncbi:YoqO family protein [Bacillus mobilis]|uniref:YoqO family protein n=1 Tax=Bacillus mobilis TaxID=2026190 RepID=UPI002E1B69A6|nr:YoqO family protein [Bacillus mobilis]MED0931400.1 YoqO family protein [Bacillus mobilis]MED0955394.1 YoqO family protein [Bacillus mobilis]